VTAPEDCTDPNCVCHGNPHFCSPPGVSQDAPAPGWTCDECGSVWTVTRIAEMGTFGDKLLERGHVSPDSMGWQKITSRQRST
jgi:hypothetical protein